MILVRGLLVCKLGFVTLVEVMTTKAQCWKKLRGDKKKQLKLIYEEYLGRLIL